MCENAKMIETLSTLIEDLDVKNCVCHDNCDAQYNPCSRMELRGLLNYTKTATEQGVDMESVCIEHLKNSKDLDKESRALIKAVLILIQKLKRTDTSSDFHKQIINQILTSSSMSCVGKKC